MTIASVFTSIKAFFASVFTRQHINEAELDLIIAGKVAAEIARVLPAVSAAVPALGAAAMAVGAVATATSVLAPKVSAELSAVSAITTTP